MCNKLCKTNLCTDDFDMTESLILWTLSSDVSKTISFLLFFLLLLHILFVYNSFLVYALILVHDSDVINFKTETMSKYYFSYFGLKFIITCCLPAASNVWPKDTS